MAEPKKLSEALDQLDERMTQVARLSGEVSRQRRRADKHYNELRRLEAAVRTATDPLSGVPLAESFRRLVKLLPKNPRPTLAQLRRSRHR